ncbi:MAG: hypothetical protein U1F71_23735 [Verrucomicrobiaceae bacterium]
MNRLWIKLAVAACFLMAQVVSVAGPARNDAKPVCQMKCCVPGATSCCCAEPTEAPLPPAPINAPPVTGRDLAPVTWLEFTPVFPLETFVEESTARFDACHVVTQRHVRLAVLFCAILI